MANTVSSTTKVKIRQSPRIKVNVGDDGALQATPPITLKNVIGDGRSFTELVDVQVTNPSNSNILAYVSNTGLWTNRAAPTLTGNTTQFVVANTSDFDYSISLSNTVTVRTALIVGNSFSTNSSYTYAANAVISVANIGSAYIANAVIVGGTTLVHDIIPDANNIYTIGNTTNRFATLYLSGNTLYMGNVVFEDTNTALTLTTSGGAPLPLNMGNTAVNGSLSVTGAFTSESLEANTLTIHRTANLQGNVVVGGYTTFANAVTFNPGTVVGTNETVTNAGIMWNANAATALLLTDGSYFRNILKYDSATKDIWIGHGSTSWIDDVIIAAGSYNANASVVLRSGSVVGLAVNTTQTSVLTDLSVAGNLTVSGTTTYINTTNLNVGDNIVTLNADLGAVAPSENSGIEVNRGSSANATLLWNETDDKWTINNTLNIKSLSGGNPAIELDYVGAANTRWFAYAGPGYTGFGTDDTSPMIFYNAASEKFRISSTGVTITGNTITTGTANVAGATRLGTGSANYLYFTGAASGGTPMIQATGSDANVTLVVAGKGNGSVVFDNPGYGNYFAASHAGPTTVNANFLRVTGTATGTGPNIRAQGSDTNIDFNYLTQGTGSHQFYTGATPSIQFRVADTAGATNYGQIAGSTGSSAVILSAQGSNTNIAFTVASKGSSDINLSAGNGGWVSFNAGGVRQVAVKYTASAVNYTTFTGGQTGNDPTLDLTYSVDADVGFNILTKGAGVVKSTGPVQVEADTVVTTKTLTTTAITANQVIATFAGATYRSAEFIIQATDTTGTKYQKTKMLAVHNGTTAEYVEYGNVNIGGDCGTFDVSYSAGIQLRVTPASTNSTVFKVTCILTKV